MQDIFTIELVFSLAILLFSVVMHEVSHGLVANYLGDPTARLQGRLTLNPIKHLDPIGSIAVPFLTLIFGGVIFGWAKPVPYNPYNLKAGRWSEAWVAAAGPLSNFLLAVVFSFILKFAPIIGVTSVAFYTIGSLIVYINVLLGVFNLIPIPPLDGSKILFAAAPPRFHNTIEWMNRNSLLLILLILFVGLRFIVFLTGLITSILL